VVMKDGDAGERQSKQHELDWHLLDYMWQVRIDRR
jgi:hypothetical protein